MKTVEEIELEIKKKKITKSYMPHYIKDLLSAELEDSENNAFLTGKEEGKAEVLEEIEINKWAEQEYEGQTIDQLEFALKMLKEVKSGDDLDNKIFELEMQLCRQSPILRF